MLARLRSIGFHGLTNVNVRSNYSMWAKCSRNPGQCPSSLATSTSWTLSVTGVRIGMGLRFGTTTVHLLPPWRRGAEDCVRLVQLYKPEAEADKKDFKFRAVVLFLPQCGVFYCARERREECVGVPKSLIPLDMSWLRLEREDGPDGSVLEMISGRCLVSAWRISRRRTSNFRQNCVMYRMKQCSDSNGPMLAPDVSLGEGCVSWPHADLSAEYNKQLAGATSARKDDRHYALSCHHFRILETCWMIKGRGSSNDASPTQSLEGRGSSNDANPTQSSSCYSLLLWTCSCC